jgi:hypothetical protein
MNSTSTPARCSTVTFSSLACTEKASCSKYPSLPFSYGRTTSLTHFWYEVESNQPFGCTAYFMLLCGYCGPRHSLSIRPFGTPFQIANAGSLSPLMVMHNTTVALLECPLILPLTDLVPILAKVFPLVSSKSMLVSSIFKTIFTSYLPATICC